MSCDLRDLCRNSLVTLFHKISVKKQLCNWSQIHSKVKRRPLALDFWLSLSQDPRLTNTGCSLRAFTHSSEVCSVTANSALPRSTVWPAMSNSVSTLVSWPQLFMVDWTSQPLGLNFLCLNWQLCHLGLHWSETLTEVYLNYISTNNSTLPSAGYNIYFGLVYIGSFNIH